MRVVTQDMPPHSWVVMVVLVVLGLVGCGQPNGGEDAGAVVQRFLAARQDRNLDGAMDCFSEVPEMRSSPGLAWTGREAVRTIMGYRLLNLYNVGNIRVIGNHVIWSEHVQRSILGSPVVDFDEEVEAVVVNGHIGSLETYVAGAHPRQPAAAISQPTSVPWVGVDLLAPLGVLVLVAAAVLVWPQPQPIRPAQAEHHLLTGLREYVARRG